MNAWSFFEGKKMRKWRWISLSGKNVRNAMMANLKLLSIHKSGKALRKRNLWWNTEFPCCEYFVLHSDSVMRLHKVWTCSKKLAAFFGNSPAEFQKVLLQKVGLRGLDPSPCQKTTHSPLMKAKNESNKMRSLKIVKNKNPILGYSETAAADMTAVYKKNSCSCPDSCRWDLTA